MDKFTFLKRWFDAEMQDENNQTTEQEMAYILFAAAKYAFEGEKINMGEVFGKDFRGLNRSMPNIYSQMDNIKIWTENNQNVNQKYDNESIKKLAEEGLTQKAICEKLGYDINKSKSLSSNAGYRAGRQIFLERKKKEKESLGQNSDSSVENCQKTSKNEEKIKSS